MPELHLATFTADVTPPEGHPLCGGWIEPVRGVDDPLRALGVVLLGMGRPVVLCAVDWCGIRNEAHRAWREALAKAAHTVPENVAVQTVHPHDAPFADIEAQKLLDEFEPLKASIYSPGSRSQQLVHGKKVSVVDWDHIEKMGNYMKQISEAYGFPIAVK